nr:MAG TPA: hypothetical protein [Caudoviricetes sp.]
MTMHQVYHLMVYLVCRVMPVKMVIVYFILDLIYITDQRKI